MTPHYYDNPHNILALVTNLPSGEREPSDDVPRRRVWGWRWSGRSSLSIAIMFHSCLRFRAFLTFFTSRWRVLLSTDRFCSCEIFKDGQTMTRKNYLINKYIQIKQWVELSPFAFSFLSSCLLCLEAFFPSTSQKSMTGQSRTSLHQLNPLCI